MDVSSQCWRHTKVYGVAMQCGLKTNYCIRILSPFIQYSGHAALNVTAAYVIEHIDPLLYKLPLMLYYVLLQSVVVVLQACNRIMFYCLQDRF